MEVEELKTEIIDIPSDPLNSERCCPPLREDNEFTSKLIYTLCYLASFSAVGCVVGLLGPSFLDLQLISGTNVEQGSRIFTSQSAGHMSGTLVSSFLYDHINRNFLFIISLVTCSLSTIFIPWCSIFPAMIVIFVIRGISMGLLDTGCNAGTVEIWGKDSGPFMQALHFAFAIGAMISPLLATPFLAPALSSHNNTIIPSHRNLSIPFSFGNSSLHVSTPWELRNCSEHEDRFGSSIKKNTIGLIVSTTSSIHYAYLIVGLWILTTSLPFMVRFSKIRKFRISKQRSSAMADCSIPLSLPVKICCLTFLGVFFALYAGSCDCFSAFLMTFAVQNLRWTKPSGLLLTTAYWAAFAASRGLSVIIAKLLSPDLMIFGNYITMIGAILGIMFGSNDSELAMWICSVFVGLSMSSTFPAAFTWTEQNLFKVSGKLSAFFILSASIGAMTLPILLGYLYQEHSKLWYVYIILGSATLCISVFIVLVIVVKCHQPGAHVPRQHDEMTGEEMTEKLESPVKS